MLTELTDVDDGAAAALFDQPARLCAQRQKGAQGSPKIRVLVSRICASARISEAQRALACKAARSPLLAAVLAIRKPLDRVKRWRPAVTLKASRLPRASTPPPTMPT